MISMTFYFIQRNVDASDTYDELSKSGLLLGREMRGRFDVAIAVAGSKLIAVRLAVHVHPTLVRMLRRSLVEV